MCCMSFGRTDAETEFNASMGIELYHDGVQIFLK